MTDRTIRVRLQAQAEGYIAGMKAARQVTKETATEAEKAAHKFRETNDAFEKVGKGAAVVGATAAAGIALVVKASAEYGAKMAQLQSLSHATTSQMAELSAAAMKQGQAFGQSATEVADAEIELTKAGRSAAQIMGGDLKGALALAAAGQLDVAKATQIGVTAVTQFGKTGATIPHVADLLAAGADKALGSVEDLGMALNQGGLVASQMGVSLDETTGTLAAFANAGLLGSDAGTSMKTMLLALQSPSKQAGELLKEYNVHAYDTEGHFVGLAGLAGQLKNGFKDASDSERDFAMSTIFGSDAIRSANVLFNEGSNGIRKWTKDVNDQGFAAAQAAGKMNSLQGDLTKLSAAFETSLIKAGTSADGGFRGIVQTATSVVQAVSDIPAPLQTAGIASTALVAGVGLLGGAFLLAVPKMAAFKTSLETLNITGSRAAGIFGKGAGLVVGVAAVASGLAAAGQHGMAGAEDMAKAADTITGRFKNLDAEFAKGDFFTNIQSARQALSQSYGADASDAGIAKAVKAWTGGLIHFSDVWESNEAKFNAFGQQLSALASSGDYRSATTGFNQYVKALGGGPEVLQQLQSASKDYREEIINQLHAAKIQVNEQNILNGEQGKGAVGAKLLAAANAKAAAAAASMAEGIGGLSNSTKTAADNIGDLEKAIKGFGSSQLDARGASRKLEAAIDDATATIKKNGKTLDDHTAKGRANGDALDAIAEAAKEATAKTLHLTGSTTQAAAKMQHGRDAFIQAAEAAGQTAKQAKHLADQLGLIPSNVSPSITLKGGGNALQNLIDLQNLIAKVNGSVVTVETTYAAHGWKPGMLGAMAGGGSIDGPGAKGVDSVPILAAPGEHVLTTRDVDAMGGQGGVYAFRAALHGGMEAYAKGGSVKKRRGSHPAPLARVAPKKKPKLFGGIVDQTRHADTAAATMRRQLSTYNSQKKTIASAKRSQARAQKTYDAIGGGKKTAGAKKAAKVVLDRAKRRETSLEKAHERTKTRYQDAKTARDNAKAAAADIRLGREDFQSAERRDPTRRSTDPLAYVDQLRAMSRDENFSPTRRKAMDKAANDYERTLVKLTASSEKAKEKLDNLKEASTQLHDSIRDAVKGGFQASSGITGARDASTRNVKSGWITRNGIRMQTYSTVTSEASAGSYTAAGLASYYTTGASKAKRFADDLAKLAKKGLKPELLAEIAGYGVETGAPIVAALLEGTAAQIRQVNAGYTAIGTAADRAGTTVADDQYAKQIAAAKADADAIQKTITEDGEKLRKLIARAFGLKGYATGTGSADAGIHWVGENGPELVGFRGGERVLSANDSARWVRGSASATSGGAGAPVVVQGAPFPDTITVQDLHGFTATMRVVARQEVSTRNDEIAVRLIGAV